MNEEMNNNYNNTPNYNYEKKNNGGNVLLIILIILVTLLIALLCYKMFVYDKKNDNKETKNVVDNKKIEENDKIEEALLKSIETTFYNGRYVDILNSNKKVDKEILLEYAIKEIGGCGSVSCSGKYNFDYYKKHVTPYYDELDKKYFSDDSKISFLGQEVYALYSIDDVKQSLKVLYGSNAKMPSFKNEEIIKINRMFPTRVMYLENINKFMVAIGGGGMTGGYIYDDKRILDTQYKNSIYMIRFLETTYQYDTDEQNEYLEKYCYVIDKNNKKKEIECLAYYDGENFDYDKTMDNINSYSLSHKDELPQYEISFKVNSDNTYEFVDIKKVN